MSLIVLCLFIFILHTKLIFSVATGVLPVFQHYALSIMRIARRHVHALKL